MAELDERITIWADCRATEMLTVGEAAACEDWTKTLRAKAGEAFANGQDDKARWLRDLAKEFDDASKRYRQQQAHQKKNTEAAWKLIEDMQP